MHIIYCCKSGSHLSKVLAAIHLQELSRMEAPSVGEILSLKGFGKKELENGLVKFVGEDCYSNKVYTLAVKNEFETVKKMVYEYLHIFNISGDNILLISASLNTLSFTFGCFLYNIGLQKMGNKLIAYSIKKNYGKLIQKAEEYVHSLT